jgi:hypothetical protein
VKDPATWFVFPSRSATWNARHDIHPGRCSVYPDGSVFCVPPTVYSTICATDVTYWPYDVVNCSVEIAPWLRTGEEITVRNYMGGVSINQIIVNIRLSGRTGWRSWGRHCATSHKIAVSSPGSVN